MKLLFFCRVIPSSTQGVAPSSLTIIPMLATSFFGINLHIQNRVRYLDLMGFKYTKADLENIISKQLANLEAMGERINLLEKQNQLLIRYNNKLLEELGDLKPLIPYPKRNRNHYYDCIRSLVVEVSELYIICELYKLYLHKCNR